MKQVIQLCLVTLLIFVLSSCGGRSGSGEDAIVDNGDGTIMNNLTTQMWAKKKTKRFNSGESAADYAKKATLAGYTDWRIPTLDEFHTLYYAIDFGQGHIKKTGVSSEGDIWVIKDGNIISGAWEKEDTCCISRSFTETDQGRVWLVRP